MNCLNKPTLLVLGVADADLDQLARHASVLLFQIVLVIAINASVCDLEQPVALGVERDIVTCRQRVPWPELILCQLRTVLVIQNRALKVPLPHSI